MRKIIILFALIVSVNLALSKDKSVNNFNTEIIVEKDKELIIENWMISDSIWINKHNILQDIDDSIVIEDWMLDSLYFNK